jgi:DNA-binding XRE family transcriptional regulator
VPKLPINPQYDKFVVYQLLCIIDLRHVEKIYTKQIKQLGKEIKRLREHRKMTQLELAGHCGVDIRTIQRIERGEYGIGLHILFAIAKAFEMQPHKLLVEIKVP